MLGRVVVLVLATMQAVLARETAYLEVILFESTPPHGDGYTTYTYDLQGHFSAAGATVSAEGDIIQLHPLGLCNNSDEEDLHQYGWVGVVKLEDPALEPQPCLSIFGKGAFQASLAELQEGVLWSPRHVKEKHESTRRQSGLKAY